MFTMFLIRIANIFSFTWFFSTLKNLYKNPFIGNEALEALNEILSKCFWHFDCSAPVSLASDLQGQTSRLNSLSVL